MKLQRVSVAYGLHALLESLLTVQVYRTLLQTTTQISHSATHAVQSCQASQPVTRYSSWHSLSINRSLWSEEPSQNEIIWKEPLVKAHEAVQHREAER